MTILKIGGSLFDLPDLGKRIVRLIARRGLVRPALIAGGGLLVDAIRTEQSAEGFSDEQAHARAMAMLSFTAVQLAATHPGFRVAKYRSEIEALWNYREVPVLAPEVIPEWQSLPESWDVTSDTLAAWAAIQFAATGLILCKSVDRPSEKSHWSELAELGLVDRHFPKLVQRLEGIAVDWVNLRSKTDTTARSYSVGPDCL